MTRGGAAGGDTVRQDMASWAHVIAVRDLERSASWYRDVLGFRLLWEDVDDWRLAERDGLRVMIGRCPRDMAASQTGAHSWFGYVETRDVDALRVEFVGRGADCSGPADRPYGMREMVVHTPDGHRIVFATQLPAAGRPAAADG